MCTFSGVPALYSQQSFCSSRVVLSHFGPMKVFSALNVRSGHQISTHIASHVGEGGPCVYSAHCLTIPGEYWKSVPGCTPAKLSCLDRRQTFNELCGVEKTHPGHSSLHICVPHCLTLQPLLHMREEGGATIYMDGYGLDNVRRM